MSPKDLIKEKISILDVVSSYIKTEKSGSLYKARCPFHNEKTPSFYISLQRGSYHCYGCQAHGDIFSFVENIEKIPFVDALKMLADRAGVDLRNSKDSSGEKRLLSLLEDATTFYQKALDQSPSSKDYLLDRGLSEDTIKTFRIGFAPNEWRHLGAAMMSLGYGVLEIEKAGLIIKSDKGYYDRFRGRIMFPIRNIGGATVGFSGRILPMYDQNKDQAKYVNTPETDVYHKSRILFGYDTAKNAMHDTKEVVVVEGQMDLCMSYQAGVKNTIAVSGTAFTDEHISLIKRFVEKVKLSFDQDKAGRQALLKSARMCNMAGLDVLVVSNLGDDKDPADVIKKDKQTWIDATNNATPVITWATNEVLSKVDDGPMRLKMLDEIIAPLISSLSSPLLRDYYISEVARSFGVSNEALKATIEKKSETNPVSNTEAVEESVKRKVISDYIISIKACISIIGMPDRLKDESPEIISMLNEDYPEEIISQKQMEVDSLDTEKRLSYLNDNIFTVKHLLIDEKIEKCKTTLVDGRIDTIEVIRLINLKKSIKK